MEYFLQKPTKFSDWATRLDRYLAQHKDAAFSFDSELGLDCCTFTFGAIRAQTGCDIGLSFLGTYRTRRQALRSMKRVCGKPSVLLAVAEVMQQYGFEETPALFAQRGDAVMVSQMGGWLLGVLDLNGRDVISVAAKRLCRMPLTQECRAWRIR